MQHPIILLADVSRLTCDWTCVHLLFIDLIRLNVRVGIDLVDDEFYAQ
jgi:hypothetical protein